MSTPLRLCTKCKEFKPTAEFSKQNARPDGLNPYCKTCVKAYYVAHKGKGIGKGKRKLPRTDAQRVKQRTHNLRLHYNITPEEYDALFAQQEGKCKLCHQPPKEGKKLFVDHNHKTGKVRGLLCHKCNQGLVEDIEWHRTAIAYLEADNG